MKKVAGFSAFLLSSPAREGTRKSYCSQDDRVLFPPHTRSWPVSEHCKRALGLSALYLRSHCTWLSGWIGGGWELLGWPIPTVPRSTQEGMSQVLSCS